MQELLIPSNLSQRSRDCRAFRVCHLLGKTLKKVAVQKWVFQLHPLQESITETEQLPSVHVPLSFCTRGFTQFSGLFNLERPEPWARQSSWQPLTSALNVLLCCSNTANRSQLQDLDRNDVLLRNAQNQGECAFSEFRWWCLIPMVHTTQHVTCTKGTYNAIFLVQIQVTLLQCVKITCFRDPC